MSSNRPPVFTKKLIKRKKGDAFTKSIFLLGILLLFLPPHPVEAATLSSTGDWNLTINSANLISGAGSDLTDTYESPAVTSTLEVSGCTDETEEWWIMVKRVDQIWDSGHFVLWVKRTSEGTGPGAVNGGEFLQEVTTDSAVFVSGQGNRSGITVQYQLTGISIKTTPNIYSAAVEFTIEP